MMKIYFEVLQITSNGSILNFLISNIYKCADRLLLKMPMHN